MPEPTAGSEGAQPEMLPAPVQALLHAANAADTTAFLACFTSDGVVDDWGREFRGAAAIRAWSDREFIGVAVTLTVVDVWTDGTTTTVTAQVGGQGFTGRSHFTFTLAGQSVTRMQIRA